MKAFLSFLVSLSALLIFSGGAFALDTFQRSDKALPRTIVGDLQVGGFSRDEVKEAVNKRINEFLEKPIDVAARGDVDTVTLKELGVIINVDAILAQVPFGHDVSNSETAVQSVLGTRIYPEPASIGPLTKTEVLRAIKNKFPEIPKVKNAHFALEKKKKIVVAEQAGVTPDIEALMSDLKRHIKFLDTSPLFVTFSPATPTVVASDLETHREELLGAMPQSIKLFYGTEKPQEWTLSFEKNPEWIQFDKKQTTTIEGETAFSLAFESIAFSNYLNVIDMAKKLEQMPEDVRMSQNMDGKVTIEGHGNDGYAIEKDELLARINDAIAMKKADVEIPRALVKANMYIAPELEDMGIREIVSVGYTRFEGSPVNRTHNIGVGVSKYDGLIIPAGATFSFNDNLGEVDETMGFRKELVIKPEGTIPEFGGGLCQVSTTLYRAAIEAGFPIVDRAPHSYAVSYYSQIGGHGLDATIYPPSRDLKFINDTAYPILIHSYVDGPSAYFKLYGTRDDRLVKLEGPFVSNRRSAPAEPILVPDPKLKPGEKKQVEKAHGGFDTLWYRYITKNGVTNKEEIVSKYKAVPNKYLVGGPVVPDKEQVEANPFE